MVEVTASGARNVRHRLQVIDGRKNRVNKLPSLPIRQAIREAYVDGCIEEREISQRLHVDTATIRLVLWGWAEIERRSMALARAAMPRWAREAPQVIECEVWQEIERENHGGPKPTGGGAAAMRRAA